MITCAPAMPPVVNYPGFATIEVVGYGCFASAEPVIKDIREAIETKKRVEDRKIPKPNLRSLHHPYMMPYF